MKAGDDAVYGRKVMRLKSRGFKRLVFSMDYYLFSNILFFVGICGDIVTTYQTEVKEDDSLGPVSYLLSNSLWLISSLVDTCAVFVDRYSRRDLNAAVQISLLPSTDSR
jgi:hypothetical protein